MRWALCCSGSPAGLRTQSRCKIRSRIADAFALAISEEILFYNFANKPALRGWLVCFFTGRAQWQTAFCLPLRSKDAAFGSDSIRESAFGAARRPLQTRNKNKISAEYGQSATATTATCGRNREELLGPRPARCECRAKARSRCREPQPVNGGHFKPFCWL